MSMEMKRKRVMGAVAAVAVIAGGIATYFLVRRQAMEQAAQAKADAARQTELPPEVTLPGVIHARDVLKVAAPIEGVVRVFHVDVGAEVYEGQLLAEITSETLDSAHQLTVVELERAQTRVQNMETALSAARLEASRASADAIRARSELDRATRTYQRQKLLIGEGATPRQTFEKAEREYNAISAESQNLDLVAQHAEERVSSSSRELDAARKILEGKVEEMEVAKARVEAGQVLSPATGIISARRGQAGDEVHPSMEDLFQIATDTTNLEVTVEPSPADLARIKPGLAGWVHVADLPNDPLPAKVTGIEEGKVRLEFANPSPLVRPGQTAQVRIRVT